MKRCRTVSLVALLVLGVGGPAAHAASLSGRASTQALLFSDESEKEHFDLAQYARFHARGFDTGNTVSVSGYGRAWGDVQQGGGVEGRLYYLYLDKKELVRKTDVRVGRQFFFVSAGAGIVDGARIDARPVGPLSVTVVGGRHVLFGVTGEDTRGGDVAAAIQASLADAIPEGYLNLSYFTSYDESELARQIVGLAGNKRFRDYGELYTQLRYDLMSDVFSEVQVGARSAVVPKLRLNAEYFRSIPVFDASSIFVVFAVERFEEALLRAEYDLSPKVAVSGEYRLEGYGGGDSANAVEAGLRYRPRDGASIYAAAVWRDGAGGDLIGFELSGDVLYAKKYLVALGAQHDVYKRDLMTGSESASRIWAGGEVRLRKDVSVSARIQDDFNENFDNDVRARLALNVDF